MLGEVFQLRNYERTWGEGPGDKLIFVREVTLVAGTASIDMSMTLRKGATVDYILAKQVTIDKTAGTIAISNVAITDTATVKVLIIANAADLA